MNKPIYTLPEEFITDKSVPVHWRLYALINGFWINGLSVYASNKYFAEKLECTERHISGCLEILEKMGLLTRNIQGYNRLILQGGMNPQFKGGGSPISALHEPPVQPIAISNAINTNTADADLRIEDENPRKTKTKPEASVYEPLLRWSEERTGRKFVARLKQYAALKRAKDAGIGPARLKERWADLEEKNFHKENGLDWNMVVSSFDRK